MEIIIPPFVSLSLCLQAIEFFFFAACIGAVAILFAVMSFFYKYVDLSTYNQPREDSSGSDESDETKALILSHEQQEHQQQTVMDNHKGHESEF